MVNIPKETEQKIMQLQVLEQTLQNFLMQKQNFQAQALEIGNALKELEIATGSTYKIVGGVMVSSNKERLKKELESKKEIIELRIKNLKKQEENTKEKAEKLQSEVVKELEKK